MSENKNFDLFNEEQDQILDVLPRSMRYWNILKEAKRELGVSTYEDIPDAIRQLKRVAAKNPGSIE